MASAHVMGWVNWSMVRESDMHRTYKITFKVICDKDTGPFSILNIPALPQVGDEWNFFDDNDPDAWCWPDTRIEPVETNGPNTVFHVEYTFSTKPIPPDKSRCFASPVESPFTEPAKISGTFVKHTIQGALDKDGNPLLYPNFEQIRGPEVEFDDSRPTIRIEQNVADLQLNLLYRMKDTVNDAILWGFPERSVKLTNISWEKRFYSAIQVDADDCTGTGTGIAFRCQFYYTRILEFEINTRIDPDTFQVVSGFDRKVAAFGTMLLHGEWDNNTGLWTLTDVPGYGAPNPLDPTHFIHAKDRNNENTKFPLTFTGEPATSANDQAIVNIEYYRESNFLELGIPADLEESPCFEDSTTPETAEWCPGTYP